MENHALAIGTMKTACKVVAYPQAVPPLRTRMERAVEGPFPAFFAKAVEPVLEGRQGVIRIRNIAINVNHSGDWDESVLAQLLASKLATALANLLESSPEAVRIWPDHDAYMASFVEHKLGLAHEPEWAFPEFAALRLLSPEQAAAEVLKSRPSVMIALAANGRRVGNTHRIASRLGMATAADIVSAWVQSGGIEAPFASFNFDETETTGLIHTNAAIGEPDLPRRILKLIAEMAKESTHADMAKLVVMSVAVAAMVALATDQTFGLVNRGALISAIASLPVSDLPVPKAVAVFLKRVAAQAEGTAFLNTVEAKVSRIVLRDKHGAPGKSARRKAKAPSLQTLHSAFAGFVLLLPDMVRLGMHRLVSQRGLRESILAVVDPDMRHHLETDALLLALFPEYDDRTQDIPPVPQSALASIAPESRSLVTGREGAEGWGDLLLASFASRLPGLRASSRGYLIRQFLAVPGRADITGEAIAVSLEGPALAIVLKMAGLSGDQTPIPFFANRLLIIKLGGSR
jgi:uncharacterized membrane protein